MWFLFRMTRRSRGAPAPRPYANYTYTGPHRFVYQAVRAGVLYAGTSVALALILIAVAIH